MEHQDLLVSMTIIFDFKLLVPRIFQCPGSSADAEIAEGVRPNQEPLSLPARTFFSSTSGAISFSLGRFFLFSLPKDFFLLLIFP